MGGRQRGWSAIRPSAENRISSHRCADQLTGKVTGGTEVADFIRAGVVDPRGQGGAPSRRGGAGEAGRGGGKGGGKGRREGEGSGRKAASPRRRQRCRRPRARGWAGREPAQTRAADLRTAPCSASQEARLDLRMSR